MAKKITNKDYIAINRDGVFVGNQRATRYQGKPIAQLDRVENMFAFADAQGNIEMSCILEIRVMLSNTSGNAFVAGNPIPAKDGVHVWIQAVTEYGVSPWICRFDSSCHCNNPGLIAIQTANTLAQFPQWREIFLKTSNNGKKAELAHAKESIKDSSDYGVLQSVGKLLLKTYDEYSVILHVELKNKKISDKKRIEYGDISEDCLKSIGFEEDDISNIARSEPDALSLVDMEFEYDLNKKPYTIVNAKPDNVRALSNLLQRAKVETKIEQEGRKVPVAEFQQALANYLNQR